MLIGYMHYRKNPQNLNKAYAFAAVANAEGAELLYFSPGMVNPRTKTINGYMYKNGGWIRAEREYPDVICNVTGFSKLKQDLIADKLSEEIPFTSHAIGDKWTVFKNLSGDNAFPDCLTPTEKVSSAKQFYEFLEKHKKAVLKPSAGCRGTGVYYIGISDKGSYEIQLGDRITYEDAGRFSDFISALIQQEEYLAQPYINCRTKAGNPYDFRLHAQKDGTGRWLTVSIYPRISESGSIVCNIAKGTYTTGLNKFLKNEFGEDREIVRQSLDLFSLGIASRLDAIQKELYQEELDELGIDAGLDENRKIHLYEVNWRPGTPPSMYIDLNTVKYKIQYAMYLASKRELAG